MAKKNVAGALVGTAIRGGLGFALSRGKTDPITGIATAPTTGDRFRTAARLTIPAFAAEDRFQTEQEQLGITRAGLAETRARTNISALQEANLDKRLDFDTILPQGLKGDSFLIPEVKDLLTSMGAGLNKDGEITARTFKESNDTDEGRQSFQRGMKGIIERRLGNLDKSEAILKGSVKNQLDKFNEANGTNITLEDLNNPEIRENLGDSKLLEQSKNLQGIQQKREIFRGARDKLDDILGSEKVSAFQEKVNALIPIVGEEEAIKIVTKTITAATDPITKKKVRFDLSQVNTAIDTSSIPDNQKAELKLLSDEASGMTLWEASDLSTGIISGARNAYNKLSSLTGLPPALATEGARIQLQTAGIALTTALSNNSRYPEGLRKWILEQTDIQPSIFQSPKLLRQNFITLDTFLNNKILDEIQNQQLGTLSPKEIIESNIALNEMNNFRKMMGVPEEAVSKVKSLITDKSPDEELDLSPDALDRLEKYKKK